MTPDRAGTETTRRVMISQLEPSAQAGRTGRGYREGLEKEDNPRIAHAHVGIRKQPGRALTLCHETIRVFPAKAVPREWGLTDQQPRSALKYHICAVAGQRVDLKSTDTWG